MEDYNPLRADHQWRLIGEFWYVTATQGPQAGLDVVRPHYVEHVTTGAMFIPGAGALGKAFQYKGGIRGGISLHRAMSKPGGKIALALQADVKHRSKGIAMMDASRVFARANSIETAKLLHDRDYDAAAVNWFGPPGALLAFEYAKGKLTDNGKPRSNKISPASVYGEVNPEDGVLLVKAGWSSTKQPKSRKRPSRSSKKSSSSKRSPSSFTSKQKKAFWRMGMRWCKKHRRYDRCGT